MSKTISAIKVYFKLAWFCKTPFIFSLDTKYKVISGTLLAKIATKIKGSRFEPNFNDCNDYAWRFKAEASHKKQNGVGFVIGLSLHPICPHCWNIAICPNDIKQIEPQTARIFGKDKRYLSLAVII